jgi:ornithine cyclodeaminase
MTFTRPTAGDTRFAVHYAAEIRAAVDFTGLVEPMRTAFKEFSAGRAQQTMSVLYPAERPADGDVLIKSGCIAGHGVFVVKASPWFLATQRAAEPQGGLATVFDATTGHPLAALIDEHYLSDIRTAAAGAVTSDLLAPAGASTAGILGTGAQAYWQALALAHVRPIESVRIWGRSPERANALVDRLAPRLPEVNLTVARTPDLAVRGSDVIVTATAATEPLLDVSWLEGPQHILSVGADTPGKCELPPAVLARADLLVVDSREAAKDMGNVARALAVQAVTATDLTELGDLLDTGYEPSSSDLTVASLVGLGVQDVIAAEHALNLLNRLKGPDCEWRSSTP